MAMDRKMRKLLAKSGTIQVKPRVSSAALQSNVNGDESEPVVQGSALQGPGAITNAKIKVTGAPPSPTKSSKPGFLKELGKLSGISQSPVAGFKQAVNAFKKGRASKKK